MYNGGGFHCTAQYNYWGSNPPDPDEFYTPQTIEYNPWLPDLLEQFPLSGPDSEAGNRDDLTTFGEFTRLYVNGQYQSAINLGLVLLDSLKNHTRAANVLGLLWRAYHKTGNLTEFERLLDRLIKKYPEHRIEGWAKMFQAAVLAVNKDYTQVLQLYQSVANQFSDSQLECNALYEQFMLYLVDLEDYPRAQAMLSDLQRKYPGNEYTVNALEIFSMYSSIIEIPSVNKEIVSMAQNTEQITEFKLYQNYPNPFNPATTITIDLPVESDVSLKVFNILGEHVRTLVSDRLSSGRYRYSWHSAAMPSGVYVYRLEADGYVETLKMILMR